MIKQLLLFQFFSFVDKMKLPLAHGHSNLAFLNFSLFVVVFFGYFTMTSFLLNGQSLGKLVLSLKVISKDETQKELTISQSILRTLGLLLGYLTGFSLFIIPFFRKDEEGLHDWLSNTKVLDISPVNKILENESYYHENESFDLILEDEFDQDKAA